MRNWKEAFFIIAQQHLDELLNLLSNGVIINDEQEEKVAEIIEQMKKKTVINNHPYEISKISKHGEDYYLTYVYDETKKNHRRQISAKTLENLENKIYDDYLNKTVLTFEKVSKMWLMHYRSSVKDTTFDRTMSDYNRFIPTCSFAQKSISSIKPIEIQEYLQNIILKEKLKVHAYRNMKSIFNGVFKYAYNKEFITKNPMEGLEVSTSNLERPSKKSKEEVVFTRKETDLIKDFIKADSANYKTSVPFAILLSFQLGLRVGELIALKWTDISNGAIHIQRQEVIFNKYDEDLNKVESSVHEIREYTKSQAGDRKLPLTPEAKRILNAVEHWNLEHGIKSDFIFANEDGKTFNRQRINTYLYNYCVKVDIIKKSSHKIRRFVLSNLLDNIVNKVSVQHFAGHEDLQTTLNAYYKDISDDEDLLLGMCSCL